jgi:hypothetical protein
MRTYSQKQNQPQKPITFSLARANVATLALDHREHPVHHLQRALGNQAVQPILQTHAEGADRRVRLSTTGLSRFGYDFSQIPIHSSSAGAIQTKLAINEAGDEYEQEAERVSGQMMRMSEPHFQRSCACGGGCPKCRTEQSVSEPEGVQTKRVGSGSLGRTAAPPIVHEVLRSAGHPLDLSARSFMEPRFGLDFAQVRVHTDARAGDSARALEARAYTVGRDMVFAPEQYAPGTAEGRRLLAHELTHVVQQRSPTAASKSVVMRQAKPVESEFSACTGNQPKEIDAAVQNAKKAINAAASVVGSAYGKPSSLTAAHKQLLMDHFHTSSHDDLRKILGIYGSIRRAFESGLKFQCETICDKTPKGNVCGYAYNTGFLGGKGPIHICFDTKGCDFTTSAAQDQVALVIHEAAHRHAGVDDKVYHWASGYANLSAKDALDNADSYAWFAVLV